MIALHVQLNCYANKLLSWQEYEKQFALLEANLLIMHSLRPMARCEKQTRIGSSCPTIPALLMPYVFPCVFSICFVRTRALKGLARRAHATHMPRPVRTRRSCRLYATLAAAPVLFALAFCPFHNGKNIELHLSIALTCFLVSVAQLKDIFLSCLLSLRQQCVELCKEAAAASVPEGSSLFLSSPTASFAAPSASSADKPAPTPDDHTPAAPQQKRAKTVTFDTPAATRGLPRGVPTMQYVPSTLESALDFSSDTLGLQHHASSFGILSSLMPHFGCEVMLPAHATGGMPTAANTNPALLSVPTHRESHATKATDSVVRPPTTRPRESGHVASRGSRASMTEASIAILKQWLLEVCT